ANLELDHRFRFFNVTVPADLGDPMFPEKDDIRRKIIAETPDAAFGANFVIYFTWNIESIMGGIAGQNFGQVCFVEKATPKGASTTNMMITGHEIGHGLGLTHTRAGFLMARTWTNRTSMLQQFEIDLINKTDQVP